MAKSKNTEIKTTRTATILGHTAGFFMKLWSMTLRYDVNDKAGVVQPYIHSDPVIFALWHNRIFTMPPIWQRTGGKMRKSVVLTSASKDGTILATAMKVFGLGAIRGSSSRRAVSALIGMKKALREGFDVCVTPDGPKGPKYTVQPGVIKIAQATGTDIIPIHIRYSSAWRLNTWDDFVIPKPFSSVSVTFAPPFKVPKGISEVEFEERRIDLEERLRKATTE
ncbi:lysophospholipid acyltransferase family protein [Luteolibacter sp. AS25]|uniref:lysophospholipid acyltransferase family protein n=1 Tax=Luteolibacter sp. AS25 TaxID=3135776 RepID=UPI00398B543F